MRFSIIIPAYNVEDYIEYCIKSVCEQDFGKDQYEVIVVDDKSSDNTPTIVKKLQGTSSNIKLIRHSVNKKQGGARNTAIKIAKGEYLIFVDSDDCFLYKNVLSILDQILLSNEDIDMLRAKYRIIDSSYRENIVEEISDIPSIEIRTSRNYLLEGRFPCHIHSACFKRKLILDNNLYFRESVFFEDTDWIAKILYVSSKIGFIDCPFYGYRENLGSTTRSWKREAFLGNILGCMAVYDFFEKDNIDSQIKTVMRERIKASLLSYVRSLGRYKILDSLYCVKFLGHSGLMNLSLYDLSIPQRGILMCLKFCSLPLVFLLRYVTLLKRFILNLSKNANSSNSIG